MPPPVEGSWNGPTGTGFGVGQNLGSNLRSITLVLALITSELEVMHRALNMESELQNILGCECVEHSCVVSVKKAAEAPSHIRLYISLGILSTESLPISPLSPDPRLG